MQLGDKVRLEATTRISFNVLRNTYEAVGDAKLTIRGEQPATLTAPQINLRLEGNEVVELTTAGATEFEFTTRPSGPPPKPGEPDARPRRLLSGSCPESLEYKAPPPPVPGTTPRPDEDAHSTVLLVGHAGELAQVTIVSLPEPEDELQSTIQGERIFADLDELDVVIEGAPQLDLQMPPEKQPVAGRQEPG